MQDRRDLPTAFSGKTTEGAVGRSGLFDEGLSSREAAAFSRKPAFHLSRPGSDAGGAPRRGRERRCRRKGRQAPRRERRAEGIFGPLFSPRGFFSRASVAKPTGRGEAREGGLCAFLKSYGVLNYSRRVPSAGGDACRFLSLSADRAPKGTGLRVWESASLNILTYRAKCIKYTAKALCDATFRLRPPFLTF